MTMVEGGTLDKRSGLSLEDCVKLCHARVGCTHYNFYYR